MSESINLIALILEASLLVQIVMGILLLASMICWVMIFRLSTRISAAKKHDEQFETWFWSGDNLARLYQGLHNAPDRHDLAQIFYVGYSEFIRMLKNNNDKTDIIDGVERKLRVGLGRQQQALESGLAILASIGSVAPYIGLFGTVWGIMNAFMGLSQTEQVSLAAVAPGIAEALIATAMGLFAAIPAVLAYNHFSAKAGYVYESRSLFCEEMTGMLLRNPINNKNNPPTTPTPAMPSVNNNPVNNNPVNNSVDDSESNPQSQMANPQIANRDTQNQNVQNLDTQNLATLNKAPTSKGNTSVENQLFT